MGPFPGTDRFQVRGHLGSGGFGDVYRVYDRQLGTTLALKTLHKADPAALYHFKKEFRALAELTHPNLVQLYEFLSDGERWYFTMELVEGEDFLAYVRGGSAGGADDTTLSFADAAPDPHRLRGGLRQLATGLHALHEAGKLHCDVKPSNVRVTPEGRVVLLDFGLSRELHAGRTFYSSHELEIVGTPAYMAPEQGESDRTTKASDWYAVGVVLYQALTGRLPFSGAWYQIMTAKKQQEAPPPRQLSPHSPADLSRLCEELLAREAERRPTGEQVVARLGGAAPAPVVSGFGGARLGESPSFVGREGPLAELRQAFELTRRGRAAAVFVHGRSGIGKTALVRRFVETVCNGAGAVVLAGRCYERESVPYQGLDALVDALTRYLKRLPADEAEGLAPPDVLALARLFPVLRRVAAVEKAPALALEAADGREQKRQAMTAFRELLRRLAERHPLLLLIDDLQWGDRDSADLLAALLEGPEPPPLMLVACFRGAKRPPLVEALLASRLPAGGAEVREIAVAELAPAEALELGLALLGERSEGSAALARQIAAESGGNPLFVAELVRAVQAALRVAGDGRAAGTLTGAVGLDELVARRVADLAPGPRRLLEVVAVAGQPVALETAVAAAGLDDAPHAAVKALRDGNFVRTSGLQEPQIEAYHDRIRDAVVRGLDGETLHGCCRRLAQALEATGHTDPETLASLFRETGKLERAAELAAAAAERADEALAFDRAARLYRLALSLEGEGDAAAGLRPLQVKLGHALACSGRYAEAAEAYLAAASGAAGIEGVELRLRAAEYQFMAGKPSAGLETLAEVLASTGLRLPRSPRQALLMSLPLRLYVRLRGLSFRERDADRIPADQLLRMDVCWWAFGSIAVYDSLRGFYFAARHLVLALSAGEPYRVARTLAAEGFLVAARGGRETRSDRLLQRAMALAIRLNHPYVLGRAIVFAGLAAFFRCRPREAVELLARGESVLRDSSKGVGTSFHGVGGFFVELAQDYQLSALLSCGRLREVSERLPRALADVRGQAYFELNLRSRVAWFLWLAADRPDEARRELAEAGRHSPFPGFLLPSFFQLCGKVETALYDGYPLGAWEAVEETWDKVRRSLLLRYRLFRVEAVGLRCRAALAVAAALGPQAREARRLRRYLRRLEAEKDAWSRPLAQLLRAGMATLRPPTPIVLDLLASAEAGFEATDRELHAAVCRLRRGQMLGPAAGRGLVEDAERWCSGQGIVDVERLAGVLAPGIWRQHSRARLRPQGEAGPGARATEAAHL